LDATQGTFKLTAASPSISEDSCGYIAATQVTINPLTVSGAACNSATGTEDDTYPPEYGNDVFSTTWSTHAAIPAGETSVFDQWGPDGYSDQALFKGLLTTSAGSAQFSGRTVKESASSVGDGCAQLDPQGLTHPIAPSDLASQWNVLSDGPRLAKGMDGIALTWALLYDATERQYWFNVGVVHVDITRVPEPDKLPVQNGGNGIRSHIPNAVRKAQ